MPRPERPLDAGDTELGKFAADLRKLREKAGRPSYRDLASRAHYSNATLADAASGKKLPSLAVTLAYVAACGGDETEWEQRWRAIAAPPAPSGAAPYVGLQAFQPEDADRFFGREKLTAKLVELQRKRAFVGVFGASGSGKSSLLRAGLSPRLDNAVICTPGARPREECAVRLARLTGDSAVVLRDELKDPAALGLRIKQHDEDLVLVVDQFEEVFTLTTQEERDWFIAALTQAPHVVIGVRADFYGHISRHPELVEALEGAQLLVGPMTSEELRQAITEPARRVGATVETALVTRLVADVAGQAGALPLAQHALVETWHRRRGMALTLSAYEEAGGVEHAIARTAEAVFNDLTGWQQRTAKRIFLRLIALGEGTEDTKRRAPRRGLDYEVLDRLASARLVVVTGDHVELTHEALIRSWPRLTRWIAEDRAKLRVHHQLTEAANQWDGKDPDVLYTGGRLAQATELDFTTLTEPERAFLTASQAGDRRRHRRTRVVMSLLTVLVLLLAGTVVFAVAKATESARRHDAAIAAVAATQARWLMQHDLPAAARVAAAAYKVAPTPENRDVLLSVNAALPRPSLLDVLHTVRFDKVTGGRFYEGFVESTNTVRLWDVRGNDSRPYLTVPGKPLAMSDDGTRLLIGTEEGVALLDVADPARMRTLATIPGLVAETVTADRGSVLVAGRSRTPPAGTAGELTDPKLWRFDGGTGFQEIAVPGEGGVFGLAVSPDGTTVAASRVDGVVTYRNDGGALRQMAVLPHNLVGTALRGFSPNGRYLLVEDANSVIKVWDLAQSGKPVLWAELPVVSRDGSVRVVEFAPDSGRVAVATELSIRVWDLRNGAELLGSFEGFAGKVTSLDLWPATGHFVAVLDSKRMWHLDTVVSNVFAQRCEGTEVRLSDEEWARYFPDVERIAVC